MANVSFVDQCRPATAAEVAQTLSAARNQSAPTAAQLAVAALDLEALAAAAPPQALAAGVKPGVERWPVKTGTDDDNAQVKKIIVQTTVRELGSLPRPPDLMPPTSPSTAFDSKRTTPVETTVWTLTAQVTALKLEADGDYHLVLQDESGAEMVAEIPLPKDAFISSSSPFFKDVSDARAVVDAQFGPKLAAMGFLPSGTDAKLIPAGAVAQSALAAAVPPRTVLLTSSTTAPQSAELFSARIEPATATLVGVGFFDRAHGQTGAAPNVVELHPVLRIAFA